MPIVRGTEHATIDCCLVVINPESGDSIGLDTANQVGVAIATETTDAVKLIVKGKLIAQKKGLTTVTGNTLTLTDNVFNYELAKILQGGTINYWTSTAKTATTSTPTEYGIAGYVPPVAGSDDRGEKFTVDLYTGVYDASGEVQEYQKISYPNCSGQPFGIGAQDGTFRVQEMTIDSAPSTGQAPYEISIVETLPTVTMSSAGTDSNSGSGNTSGGN